MGLEACVHRFTICPNDQCSHGWNAHHLNVERTFVPIERGRAVALSYVWGQFSRERRTLGHFTNGEPVTLELGEDWQLDELKQALHNACNRSDFAYDCKYLWIDQLSIPQDETDVRRTLVQIPQIYSSFDVLVLLQGGLCGCWASLKDVFDPSKISFVKDLWNRAITHSSPPGANQGTDLTSAQEEQLFRSICCVNNSGFISWSGRVWTRQELLGSQKILARWISSPVSCPTLADQGKRLTNETEEQVFDQMVQGLTLPSRLNFETWMRRISESPRGSALTPQQLKAQVYTTLSIINSETFEQGASDLLMGRGLLLVHEYEKWVQAMKFLNGIALEDEQGQRIPKTIWSSEFRAGVYNWKQWLNTSESFQAEVKNLWQFSKEGYRFSSRTTKVATGDFVAFLHAVRAGGLTATKKGDYVRAVWVSCPGYELPSKLSEKRLGPLLQDAIEQFQARGRLLITTAPAGLFGQIYPSASWSPQLYLNEADVTAADDVYGPLFERTPDDTTWMSRQVAHLQSPYLQTTNNKLPVTIHREAQTKPRHLLPCDAVPADMTSRQFVEWLKGIVNQKQDMSKNHGDCLKKIEAYLLQHQWSEPSETVFCKFLRYFTVAHNFSDGFSSDDLEVATTEGSGEQANNSALTPTAINWRDLISSLVCVSLGLPRALAARQGLLVYSETQVVGMARLGLFSRDFTPDMQPDTVQVLPEKTLFYEAVKVGAAGDGSDDKQRYRIVGVWVPWMGHDRFGDAALVVDPKGTDGYIL